MTFQKTIPIASGRADESDAFRLAANEIRNRLSQFYPAELVDQTHAHKIVAAQWYGRVPGFHAADDFWHLVRDFLLFMLSGGERSAASDRLAYTFSGFMPSYGAASTCLGMIGDGANWKDVEAFMHHLSYGDARAYVTSFDWKGGQQKAQAEVDAWLDILNRQYDKLSQAVGEDSGPILLAQAQIQPNSPPGTVTDVPANDPVMPKPRPPLRLVPMPEPLPPPEPVPAPWWRIIWLLPLLLKGDSRQEGIVVEDYAPETQATVDTTNNECLKQIEVNRKNGEVCENDGYVLMEKHLLYKRLMDPPRSKGLDGLFEKQEPFDHPEPMPHKVWMPRGGKLIFLPKTSEPPKPQYDYAGEPPQPVYPRFVVFEAKNISQNRDPENDPKGMMDEAKRRLQNTCDGKQMGSTWTADRIPRALKRGEPDPVRRATKEQEIVLFGYARWVFVCLPAPPAPWISAGSAVARLYVIIDIDTSNWDLDNVKPKTRKPRKTPPDNSF